MGGEGRVRAGTWAMDTVMATGLGQEGLLPRLPVGPVLLRHRTGVEVEDHLELRTQTVVVGGEDPDPQVVRTDLAADRLEEEGAIQDEEPV